jgi:hypothetical protein
MSRTSSATSKLLQHHVATLRLRQDAPWPGHCADTRAMIAQWRRLQRMRLIESSHETERQREVETAGNPQHD